MNRGSMAQKNQLTILHVGLNTYTYISILITDVFMVYQ